VATISPAAMADLIRALQGPSDSKEDSYLRTIALQHQVVTLLHNLLAIDQVLDGNLPLHTSLEATAQAFVTSYRNVLQQQSTLNSSSHSFNDTTSSDSSSRSPMWTSSCPAVVALAETTHTKVVPWLVPIRSALLYARSFHTALDSHRTLFHVGIMPCHDKKLEVSRREYAGEVDMVLTTQECLQLLHECWKSDTTVKDAHTETLRDYWLSLPPAQIVSHNELYQSSVTMQHETNGHKDTTDAIYITHQGLDTSNSIVPEYDESFNSGGYADYCFRYACRVLFDTTVNGPMPWEPVSWSTQSNDGALRTSRRLALAQRKKRDVYQVCLYRHVNNDTYSTTPSSPTDLPVLRFGRAFGIHTLQRVWPETAKSTTTTTPSSSFDFVEAMACPHGCLNGGGQTRLTATLTSTMTTMAMMERETPSMIQERLQQSQVYFIPSSTTTVMNEKVSSAHVPVAAVVPMLSPPHFQVIPPLQHARGAVAGVAVKDTQW
jgi:hypothetical protein